MPAELVQLWSTLEWLELHHGSSLVSGTPNLSHTIRVMRVAKAESFAGIANNKQQFKKSFRQTFPTHGNEPSISSASVPSTPMTFLSRV